MLEVRATSADREGLLCGLTDRPDRPEGLLSDCCLKLSLQVKGQPLLLGAELPDSREVVCPTPNPSPNLGQRI